MGATLSYSPALKLALWLLIVAVSFVSSLYLYRKAKKRKIVWALFGAIGNINALILFWIYSQIQASWKTG